MDWKAQEQDIDKHISRIQISNPNVGGKYPPGPLNRLIYNSN